MPLPYWIEHDQNDNATGYVYVKVPSIPANQQTAITASLDASCQPDGSNTFVLFDDFLQTINTNVYDVFTGPNAQQTIENGKLKLVCNNSVHTGATLISKQQFPDQQYILEFLGCVVSQYNGGAPTLNIGFTNKSQYDSSYYFRYTPIAAQEIYEYTSYNRVMVSVFNDQWESGSLSQYETIINKWARVVQSISFTQKKTIGTFKWGNSLATVTSPVGQQLDGSKYFQINFGEYQSNKIAYLDWFALRKYADVEPTVSVQQVGQMYVITITNPNQYQLSDYQIKIPISQLSVTSPSTGIRFDTNLRQITIQTVRKLVQQNGYTASTRRVQTGLISQPVPLSTKVVGLNSASIVNMAIPASTQIKYSGNTSQSGFSVSTIIGSEVIGVPPAVQPYLYYPLTSDFLNYGTQGSAWDPNQVFNVSISATGYSSIQTQQNFNGTNSRIRVRTYESLDTIYKNRSWSISLWLSQRQLAGTVYNYGYGGSSVSSTSEATGHTLRIINYNNTPILQIVAFQAGQTNETSTYFDGFKYISKSGYVRIYGVVINANVLNHVVLTYNNSTKRLCMYLNSNLVHDNVEFTNPMYWNQYDKEPFTIGQHTYDDGGSEGPPSNFFDGFIQHFMYYTDTVLTQDNVNFLYNMRT